ncbi:hypothetical protein PI124_g19785 [Phytophthora idaei]|nr:hypothetical protein PI124_g19785 [Phytophthora idaei]
MGDRFRYIRPGGDPAGKEGLDFLLGEAAVIRLVKGDRGASTAIALIRIPAPTLDNPGTAGTVELVVVTTLVVAESMLVEAKATSVETELRTSLRMPPLGS